MSLKILQCIPTMLGGGAERQLAYLAPGLVDLGHTVHVAILQDGPNGGRLRAGGALVHTLPRRRAWDPTAVWDLVRLIRSTRADLVQTWLPRMDIWGGLAARATRRPWIVSERSGASSPHRAHDRLVSGATAVVANSETGASHWRRVLGTRGMVHVVANACPANEIADATPATRASLGVPDDAELVVYTGRYTPEKNIGVLGEALGILLARRPGTAAVCCGEGPLLPGFRAAMDARGLGARCITPGYRTDVWSVMKSGDVFMAPSVTEGRPNAVLEAMLCERPMVLSDIPQHREFVPADAALFFPVGDPRAAADALEAVLTDPTAARARVTRARAAAGAFTVEAMARAYEGIYQDILRRG